MLPPLSDVLANITLAHCDAVGRGIHSINSLTTDEIARYVYRLRAAPGAKYSQREHRTNDLIDSSHWLVVARDN